MSHLPPRAPLLLTLSDRLYRLLLTAYPVAFSREYGDDVAQVFRDCCRAAARRGGLLAVLPLWPPALLDLAVSALAERSREGIHRSRSLVTRAGAVAAMLGAVLFLAASFLPNGDASTALAQALRMASSVDYLLPTVGAAGGLFFALALVGLLARVGARLGGLGWLAAIAALLALVAESAALLGLAWGVGDGRDAIAMPIQNEADLLFCAAMIVLGIAVLRARALPTGNWIPLVIGLLSVLSGPAKSAQLLPAGHGHRLGADLGLEHGRRGCQPRRRPRPHRARSLALCPARRWLVVRPWLRPLA